MEGFAPSTLRGMKTSSGEIERGPFGETDRAKPVRSVSIPPLTQQPSQRFPAPHRARAIQPSAAASSRDGTGLRTTPQRRRAQLYAVSRRE